MEAKGEIQLPIRNPADVYLALDRTRSLISVKPITFDCTVNTSIGLPFIHTSRDCSTAFDIAGEKIADASSMKTAIQLVTELAD